MALKRKIEYMDDEELLVILNEVNNLTISRLGTFKSADEALKVLHKCFDSAEFWQRKAVWAIISTGYFMPNTLGRLEFYRPDVTVAVATFFENNIDKIDVRDPKDLLVFE